MRNAVVGATLALLLAGCANLNSIYRGLDVNGKAVAVDVKQRAVFSASAPATAVICAEPSPDSLSSYGASLGGTLNQASGTTTQLAGALAEQAASIGLRTQSIQLMRDTMYRACEAYLSGGISAEQFYLLQRRFQNLTLGLLAIEQLTGAVRAEQAALSTTASSATGDNTSVETEALKTARTELNTAKDKYDAANADLAKKQKEANDAAAELVAANAAAPADPPRVMAAKKAVSDTTEALDTQKLDVASKKRTLDSATESVKVSEKNLELANGRVKAYATGVSQFGPGGQGRLAVTDRVATAVTDIVKTVLSQSGRAEGCLGVISDFVDHPDKYAADTPGEQLLASCQVIEAGKTVERLMKSGVDPQSIPQFQQPLRLR
jgi:hypothetical protein